jgi:WXG100 family type VII secretion target
VAETTQSESSVMATTANKFETVNSELQSMLSQLMNELSVLQSAWQGAGAKAFQQVQQQYQQDLKSLNQALSTTAQAIRDSASSYDTTDSAAADRVNKSGGSFSLPL